MIVLTFLAGAGVGYVVALVCLLLFAQPTRQPKAEGGN